MAFNSDIDISAFKAIDKESLQQLDNEFYAKYSSLPEEFNWIYRLHTDTPEIIRKKKYISKVKNQYLCGCCWAISCATAISDAFVIKDLVDWSPNISYTYALATYPQQQCSGGSSRILLEDIKNGHGISSDYCVDESWCLNNKDCVSKDSSQHFSVKNKEYLSSLIPDAGCYDGNKKHYMYKIDDVYSLTVSENLEVFEAQIKIKQHIMVRGPVVGGFLIMDNFPDGEFSKKNTGGIYFENSEFNPAKNFVLSIQKEEKILGSHSVVIVGWGMQKNVKFNKSIINIPFWFCRNSWGEHWGDNGYFKIAMYPFNKICQFSKKIKVIHNGIVKEVGGVTGFNVTKYPELVKLKSNRYYLSNYKKSKELYSMDENLIYGVQAKSKHNYVIIYIALFAAILFILKNYI